MNGGLAEYCLHATLNDLEPQKLPEYVFSTTYDSVKYLGIHARELQKNEPVMLSRGTRSRDLHSYDCAISDFWRLTRQHLIIGERYDLGYY